MYLYININIYICIYIYIETYIYIYAYIYLFNRHEVLTRKLEKTPFSYLPIVIFSVQVTCFEFLI